MAKAKEQLLVRIEQNGAVSKKTLTLKENLTFGQHQKNDIVLDGADFPKKATLVSGRSNSFDLLFGRGMKGEVIAQESRLSLQDMVFHGVLPKHGNAFRYPITTGKKGAVILGNAKVIFQCVLREPEPIVKDSFVGYSWRYVTLSRLKRDMSFKIIFATVAIFHFVLLRYLSGLPVDLNPKTAANLVPERLARIIVKAPDISRNADIRPVAPTAGEDEAEGDSEESPEQSGEPKPRKVENQGLLGLLTGSGQSNQSNNLADFLLDKGLVQELDAAIKSADLTVGNGRENTTSDGIDDLLANSDLGGIDDLLSGIDDVGGTGLGKKGRIKVDQVSGMRGSQEALGSRTEQSVRDVMLGNQGRLTYIYNKHLKRDPNLSGKMVVEVVIAASGQAEVLLISSSMNNSDFEREILDFIGRWEYDAIESGSVTVTYPLFFNKVG